MVLELRKGGGGGGGGGILVIVATMALLGFVTKAAFFVSCDRLHLSMWGYLVDSVKQSRTAKMCCRKIALIDIINNQTPGTESNDVKL